jgi:hypothetical protein
MGYDQTNVKSWAWLRCTGERIREDGGDGVEEVCNVADELWMQVEVQGLQGINPHHRARAASVGMIWQVLVYSL